MNLLDLSRKKAVVTGGTRGIGLTVTAQLAHV
jgi:NAD(P)-dependent dehydrogenase (short-subunit alcohol dehydrogenase family)